jgi:orotate phosphoribosyltransferase
MYTNREKLRDMIVDLALRRTAEPVTLASGKKSNLYVNLDKVFFDSAGARLAAMVIGPMIESMDNGSVQSIGGPILGAVPLTDAILRHYENNYMYMRGFAVYKDAKSRGGIDAIAGRFEKGDNVIIVDDVCTSGGSAKYAKEMVELAGAKVIGFFAVVDRGAAGLRAFGDVPYQYLYTMEDLGEKEDVV